jgi:predicted membrane protein
MNVTVVRAIPLVLVLTIAALVLSGIGRFKHATHGVDYVVGETAWLGFLAGALAVLVLVAVAVVRRVSARRAAGVRA